MTDLDYIISGVSSYKEISEKLNKLLDALYELNKEENSETLNRVLEAYRSLIQ